LVLARRLRGSAKGVDSGMLSPSSPSASLPTTVFLLSPARCSGPRAKLLANGRSSTPLSQQLCTPEGAPLGDVFAFLSALYFRGKLAYARAFARSASHVPGALVITPGDGLIDAAEHITADRVRAFGEVDVHHDNERFVLPLVRDARALAQRAAPDARIVLLGSIASAKYVVPLLDAFGERLLFPAEFVGRGDMSRGGLLLRSAQDRLELEYRPVLGATLRGTRPPKLPARRSARALR
jgi:hypothetical protein